MKCQGIHSSKFKFTCPHPKQCFSKIINATIAGAGLVSEFWGHFVCSLCDLCELGSKNLSKNSRGSQICNNLLAKSDCVLNHGLGLWQWQKKTNSLTSV